MDMTLVITLIVTFAGGYAVGRVTAKPKAIATRAIPAASLERVITILDNGIAAADAVAAATGHFPRPWPKK